MNCRRWAGGDTAPMAEQRLVTSGRCALVVLTVLLVVVIVMSMKKKPWMLRSRNRLNFFERVSRKRFLISRVVLSVPVG